MLPLTFDATLTYVILLELIFKVPTLGALVPSTLNLARVRKAQLLPYTKKKKTDFRKYCPHRVLTLNRAV